jgi:hypothetical protein
MRAGRERRGGISEEGRGWGMARGSGRMKRRLRRRMRRKRESEHALTGCGLGGLGGLCA